MFASAAKSAQEMNILNNQRLEDLGRKELGEIFLMELNWT